jgi:ABC-2 type transport system permease protein
VNAMRLYGRYAAASVRAQLQYPASFALLSLGQFLSTIIEFVGLWALFQRFHTIVGFALPQVALFYATVNIAFALADMLSRGFDTFGSNFVRTGEFDRLLLRPRATPLQLLGHQLRLTRLGRLLQGVLVLGIAVTLLEHRWSIGDGLLLCAAIAGGVALFIGLMVLQATLAFWTVESLEIANALTYGGVLAAQYPLHIYARWLQLFFIYVVPLACVAYFPIIALIGTGDPLGAPAWLLPASPLAGVAFLALALLLWRRGVRRYTSAGS